MDTSVARGPALCFALLIGALLLGFIGLNALPLRLRIDLVTDAPDVAQLFYARNAAWSEQQSLLEPVHPPMTRVMFELPTQHWAETVRFDPGRRAAEYRILGVRWFRGFLGREVELETIASGREGMPLRRDAGNLVLAATDPDPQLVVPMPGPGWQVAGLLFPTGTVLLLVAALCWGVWRRRVGLRAMASVCVGIAAAYYGVTLTQHGAQLPMYDDWRYLMPGSGSLLGGGWRWLGIVGNDTYFLTGQVLDFFTLRLLHGNFETLRGVALGLLLLQLWLTLRLVARATTGVSPWLAVPATVLVGWSLAAGGYWGTTAIAYHQFLPVLGGSLLLIQAVDAHGHLRTPPRVLVLVLTGLACGLAYISGGLLMVCLGLGILLAQADLVRRDWRSPALHAGRLIVTWGAGLLAAQIFLVSLEQGSLLEHSHATRSVLPDDRRFWLFACAQFGRALGYGGFSASLDGALTIVALLPTAFLLWERIACGFLGGVPAARPALSALALYAGMAAAAYAAAVALGRAGFIPPDAAIPLMVQQSKGGFHYWPVAALLPFLWLGWVDVALRWGTRLPRVVFALTALVFLVPKSSRCWDLLLYTRLPVTLTSEGGYCIGSHLREDLPGPFHCDITGTTRDLAPVMHTFRDRDPALFRQFERYGHPPLP